MKARIKETGKVVEIILGSPTDNYCVVRDDNGDEDIVSKDEIKILETAEPIDWEQRRYEIAKDVLASSFSTPMEGTSILSYVRSCVQVADILIEELKGGSNESGCNVERRER